MVNKVIIWVLMTHSVFALLLGGFIGLHIAFSPNLGIPASEAWSDMLFYFSEGLLSQLIAMFLSKDQESDQTEKERRDFEDNK